MLIKKADVKNHLAAKLRKRQMLRASTMGQKSAKHSSAVAGDNAVASGSSEEPLQPASEFVLPIRSSGGQ
jgi:hypothetical protein